MIQKLNFFANRFVQYAAIRLVVMSMLCMFVSSFELTDFVDVDRMSIFPSLTETMSIYSNLQSMPVILARGMLNLSHRPEYIKSVETLYALHKLLDWQIDEYSVSYGFAFCCYSLMKFAIKRVLVCAWNMSQSEWPAIVNNPIYIRAAITPQQMDAIEFNSSHLKTTIGIFGGMIFAMVNCDVIFEAIKQWWSSLCA